MPQLSLYLTSEMMDKLRTDVDRAGISISKYVSGLISNQENNSWPPDFWSSVYGGLTDSSFVLPSEFDPGLDGPVPSFE